MKVGLVLEGGGARGAYTAGALTWLLDNDVHFDYGVGMSISALYLFAFLTDNPSMLKDMSVETAISKGTVGLPSLLREGSLVGYDKMFEEVRNHQPPLDIEAVNNLDIVAETGVYDLATQKCLWLQGKDIDKDLYYLKAAGTIPIFGKRVLVNGKYFLDAGLETMIPIGRALEQGCERCLVITTKTADYVRKPSSAVELAFMKLGYGKYKKLYELVKKRDQIYYKEREIIDRLEEEGRCHHVFPSDSCGITRFGGKHENLIKLFEVGYNDMEAQKDKILQLFEE